MYPLQPTLWRTCRVIACETRLRLLWILFETEGLGVADLAGRVGISEQNASIQLRVLGARGLITPHRRKLRVIYAPEANPEVRGAKELLASLRACHDSGASITSIIRHATAFTHIRRIELVSALNASSGTFGELREKTGISATALLHHLEKLEARHYVKQTAGVFRLLSPRHPFGKTLLELLKTAGAGKVRA